MIDETTESDYQSDSDSDCPPRKYYYASVADSQVSEVCAALSACIRVVSCSQDDTSAYSAPEYSWIRFSSFVLWLLRFVVC